MDNLQKIIFAVIVDGKRGLYRAFNEYPIQMCHFHQKKTIQRYITQNPKLEAGKNLQKIMKSLTKITELKFSKKLDEWYYKYQDFLAEKTIYSETLKESYKHQRLRSAYKSLRTNLPYLFTYQKHTDFKINNTTNDLHRWWSLFSYEKTAKNLQWIY